jgi:hypothetical protein
MARCLRKLLSVHNPQYAPSFVVTLAPRLVEETEFLDGFIQKRPLPRHEVEWTIVSKIRNTMAY